MDNNFNEKIRENTDNEAGGRVSPAAYSWDAKAVEDLQNPVILRRKIKGGYNWAGAIIIIEMIISMIGSAIFGFFFSMLNTGKIAAQNPDMSLEEITARITEMMSEPQIMVIMNSLVMTVTVFITLFIVHSGSKRFKLKDIFDKPDVPALSIILAMLAIIGIQGVSIYIQNLITMLTNYTGINDAVSSSMGFSDSLLSNILLVMYIVIIAPVMEEILFRGIALNNLAAVNRTFALFASALLFGLMHGNFNQIFNGFLLGLLLGYIALKSGSVIPSIICHIFANANAMLASYIFEYSLAADIGFETAAGYEMIYFAICAVVGMAALIFLLKRHGRIRNTDIITAGYTFEVTSEEERKLTWRLLIKSPTFWISAAYCILSAVLMVTPVNV